MNAGTATVLAGTAPAPAPPSQPPPAPPTTALPIPPHPQYPQRAPPVVSRYRSLRGKSISSFRRTKNFDIFRDDDDDDDDHAQDDAQASPASRKRPKSAHAVCRGKNKENKIEDGNANEGPIRTTSDAKQHPPLPPLPTALTLKKATSLSPKSVNILSSTPASRIIVTGPKPATKAELERLHALSKRAAELNENATERRRTLEDDQEDKEAARWADEVARLEAETDRILAEQKKRDLARLQAQLANAPAAPKPRRPIFDKLASFARGRKGSHPTFSVVNWSPKRTSSASASTSNATTPSPIEMNFIEQGGKGIVPQIDAPKAAINSGERRVTVQCLSSTINLPVTNDTTPVDIIFSTANLVSHNVDPTNSVVVECYVVMGLERRLRRYERIRDVMNSWDRDQQCSLIVMSYDNPPEDKNLYLESVPRTDDAPMGFTFQLHTSSRPGRWAKRWVTLLDNGQIFSSKKADSKATDKDSTPLCHLSDFDIYTPNQSEVTRHLKPPKKHCFAIKSQQKTVVFANGENFVHFFSTEDNDLAERFHTLVHAWRSWYLVNKQVDFTRKEASASTRTSIDQTTSKSTSSRRKEAIEKDPYLIGDFKPLLDMKAFDKPLEEFGKPLPTREKPVAEKMGKTATRQQSVRKTRLNTAPKTQPRVPALPDPFQGEREFAAGGLLGDAYDKRRHDVDAGVTATIKKADGPFTEGPSLLNGTTSSPASPTGLPRTQSWFPSATEHSARSRSQTNQTRRPTTSGGPQGRSPGRPLLNVDRNGSQPPRRMASQGRAVRAPNGGPLINLATGRAGAPLSGVTRMASTTSTHSSISRQRSSSSAESTARRYGAEGAPPVPPLPHRGMRQKMTHLDAHRGRDPRPQEPLINQAR